MGELNHDARLNVLLQADCLRTVGSYLHGKLNLALKGGTHIYETEYWGRLLLCTAQETSC